MTKIKIHDFNSQWLAGKFGVLFDLDFFSLTQKERQHALQDFQWVELRTLQNFTEKLAAINDCKFWYADTQLKFMLNLQKIPSDPLTEKLHFERASEVEFQINPQDIYPFKSERFLSLPGVTQERVDQRYLKMVHSLLAMYPQWCLRIMDNNKVQGWYFGIPNDQGIELSLAMLHKNADIRGRQLYHKAIAVYAKEFSIGTARFSANNIAVHNILAKLGARFLPPETVWFWVNDQTIK